MQKARNYYEILGVSREATLEDIKNAYRRLARQYHPDVNPGDRTAAEKFKEITEIYEILCDPRGRDRYNEEIDRIERQYLNAQEFYKEGVKKTQRGDFNGAIADYTHALQLNPNDAAAYNQRGFARYKMRDYQAAFADYTQALQLKPDFVEVYYHRGLARFNLGAIQGAIEDYTQALQSDRHYAKAYFQRGLCYAEFKERQTALADLKAAAQLFLERGDRANYQRVREEIRKLEKNAFWKEIAHQFLFVPLDAAKAAQTFALNPIGGLLPAFAKLEKSRAIATGIAFAVIFDLCFILGMSIILQKDRFEEGQFLRLAILGTVPFFNLTVASGLIRFIFRGSGSLAGDFFIAGAALLPASWLALLSGLLINWNGGAIALLSVFAACYTILTLYSGCNQISNISESRAALAVPIMLLLCAIPFVFIR